jgi:D-alanine transaminase
MSRTVYVNGSFVPEADAQISVFDRAFLFAEGVYEVTAVLGGKPLDLENHLARLDRSLAEMQIDPRSAIPSFARSCRAGHAEQVVRRGLSRNHPRRGRSRLSLS